MFDASELSNQSMFHIVSYIFQRARQACQVGRSNGCPKSKPNFGPSDLEKHLFQFHIQTFWRMKFTFYIRLPFNRINRVGGLWWLGISANVETSAELRQFLLSAAAF